MVDERRRSLLETNQKGVADAGQHKGCLVFSRLAGPKTATAYCGRCSTLIFRLNAVCPCTMFPLDSLQCLDKAAKTTGSLIAFCGRGTTHSPPLGLGCVGIDRTLSRQQ